MDKWGWEEATMQSVLKTNGLPVWEQRFFESLSLGGCRVSGVESLPSLSHNTSVQCWPGLSCRPKQYTWYLTLRTDMLCSLGFSQVCQDRQSPPGDLQAATPPYGRVLQRQCVHSWDRGEHTRTQEAHVHMTYCHGQHFISELLL